MLLISFLLTGITQAQYVGIGTTTPAKILDVNGDALINGLTIGMGSGNISTNTAIGNSVLSSNTTALGNTAVGYESQKLTTTGIANTSIGFMSMANNSEGYYNVSLGAWTLNQNSNGYHNTAVGYGSLYSNNTGFENTGLGYGAAMGAGNLQNATAIGAKAYAAASNSLILGSVAGVNGAVNSVNVGIGTTMNQLLKSGPPKILPTMGMIRSLTSESTILPNAAPMITPTARSITLPFIANSLNSLAKPMGAPRVVVLDRPKTGRVQYQ